jgi:hypothetical protein
MGRDFSEDIRLGGATDTPASENSLARERGPFGPQLAEGARSEDQLAKVQTAEVAQLLPTLGEPRVPDEGEALWEEFVGLSGERGRLNLNATQNQRQTLVIIAKLRRYHGPGWSYFLASKKMRRQRNALSDYHPIVMRALGISKDPNGRARPLTVTLDEWERSGKEPDEIPEWLESQDGVDGVYRKYLARQRRRLTKNERDMAVHELSELGPICKIALPHPLAYLDGDYQAVVHIDAIQQTLQIRAVDPKVTPAWLRANAERLLSSRAMLDMRPTPKRPDMPIDTFMTKPSLAVRLYEVTKMKIAEHEISFDRWLEPSAGDGAFYTLLPEGSLGIDIEKRIEGVIEHDFLSFTDFGNHTFCTIGNNPFGKNASLAIRFFNHAARVSNAIALILPRTFRKASVQNKLDPYFHLIHEEVVPDNSFLHMGAEVDVPCVFQIWQKRKTKRPHIATRYRGDNLEFLPPGRHHEATIAFQRIGVGAGTIKPIEPGKPLPAAQSHYFIRCDEHAHAILRAINFHTRYDTAGNPSISKSEIVNAYGDELDHESCDDHSRTAATASNNFLPTGDTTSYRGEVRNAAYDSAAGTLRFIDARDRSVVPLDDDREGTARGRPATEAVFRSKRPVTELSVSDALVPATESRRRRRVLETLSTAPVRREAAVETPVSSEQPITPEIQASQFRRVRAWAKYGMTVPQIAQTYGVAVGEIERILRKSRR